MLLDVRTKLLRASLNNFENIKIYFYGQIYLLLFKEHPIKICKDFERVVRFAVKEEGSYVGGVVVKVRGRRG